MEIPVYLFTGFLGSGKTKFIQDALEGEDFNEGEETLLLVCEEGELEYDPEKFYGGGSNVHIHVVDDEEDLTKEYLADLIEKTASERVIVEYNGMWGLDSFYNSMPDGWMVYQEMTFIEAPTFLMYNQNMRQQVYDKLKTAELVVFNRCVRNDDFSDWQLSVHKICRVANRKSQIIYEFAEDDIIMDDIQDPLPYDMNAPVIDIGEDMFAEWYRDINENQDNYDGKEIRVKGRAVIDRVPPGTFIFGRHVMTCCVQDIQFAGLLCKWEGSTADWKNGEWVKIRATVKVEYTPVYEEEGPVLYCKAVGKVPPADPEVATF
ncbi:MAG: GTP-binding protein [Eubacteriales bacterium]|nr:GTP-binding protein [Eubacteriales bacterium]